jgi:hypothetical protein
MAVSQLGTLQVMIEVGFKPTHTGNVDNGVNVAHDGVEHSQLGKILDLDNLQLRCMLRSCLSQQFSLVL